MLPEKINQVKGILHNMLQLDKDSNPIDIAMSQALELTQNKLDKKNNIIFQIQNANTVFISVNASKALMILDEMLQEKATTSSYHEMIEEIAYLAFEESRQIEDVLHDIQKQLLSVAIKNTPSRNAAARKLGANPATFHKWTKRYEL